MIFKEAFTWQLAAGIILVLTSVILVISTDKTKEIARKLNISEENLNNTNVIDVKSLKFTEDYILENME